MKVTVCFGRMGIVVPCKEGQLRVRDLTQQALQRYLKAKEKDPGDWVKIHHLEYMDGGILDPDDILADVVEDKDKLIAVFDEQESISKVESPNGNQRESHSPDPFDAEVVTQLAAFKPIGGEIEVTTSALKLGTPLLVRRSSDPALGPPADSHPGASHPSDQNLKPVVPGSPQSLEDSEIMCSGQSELLTLQKTKHTSSDMTRTVEISGEGGPLGIHVVPFFSSLSGRILGLFIRGIEENSRSKRDGLFHENECIVKINNVDLIDKTFAQAQDVFRQAMKSQSVLLQVLPPDNREQYEKSVIAPLGIFGNSDAFRTKVSPPIQVKPASKTINLTGAISLEEDTQISNQQNRSPRVPRLGRKPSSPSLSPLMGFGSKKNAKKIKIDLKKGPEGLGFTVVTRDSSIHGPGPIFVKNILPKGAAVKDGRLQSGDRILEVNGRDITGRTQEELVAMLRSTKQGETASLVIARQEESFLPRELKGEPDRCYVLSLETPEQLTFEIPLNDSGSAGLGVSLKGNKSRETGADLGIFIKSIIHGGAAFKDGRLRINDQLIAVNGESLLGKSNHEAMETLRRSMSMEGNIRGMIQLVILRRLDRQTEERTDYGLFPKPSVESCQHFVSTSRRQEPSPHPFLSYSPQERQKELLLSNANWTESDIPPPLPPHPNLELDLEDYSHSPVEDSAVYCTGQQINFRPLTSAKQPESIHLKASKSMDLEPTGKDFGPTLGLKKSSSLESLQTAVAEVRKNDLPFHRPRPHMVRGRGCNESFRAAIDKSYDGPEDLEEDGLSDKSSRSGQGAQNCESNPQGNAAPENIENKAKKNKKNKDKEKKKEKGKLKVKEKKRKEENEDPEKKVKKKGFGAMLRFGKKKEDKGGKSEQKGNLKQSMLQEEELEKMKEERERIGAKHQELREKQARGLIDYSTGLIGPFHDMDDDEMDPNYARVNHFQDTYVPAGVYRPSSPPSIGALGYPRDGPPLSPEKDHLEGLYAKINKPYHPQTLADSGRPTSGCADRIQKLRKEYHQARREGFSLYEDEEVRARPSDYEQHWVSGKSPDGSSHNLRFEGMERQCASLPRRGPTEPADYLTGPRLIYKERQLPYYPGMQPIHPPKGSYPRVQDVRLPELHYPQYYPPPPATHHKGPFRQDVPPSPPQHPKVPAYHEIGKMGQRAASPEQYPYRAQDPRQKNPMTAAV
ncbi:partitioning defective 3 homolog B isoform X2 [Antechinus flavipes]|uniref:partitioning defective 3 homolog B isoform X2 n=1 Tax=Antechinus flavipes TaxID=38775 RepID=UPI002236BDF8|nr:partitioning defective 3 homolog B isoform X2 [Antechinus flavipes]